MRRSAFRWLLCFSATAPICAADYASTLLPLLKTNCLPCHSGAAKQGNLDLTSYEAALRGGKTGPAIKPGAADGSLMIAKIASGQMPPGRKLDESSVAAIRNWIDAQKPVLAGVTEADVVPLFQMRCVVCHGKRNQEGGLDLRTQASRLRGGRSGPALIPGNAAESLIIKKIADGTMPPPKLMAKAHVRPPDSGEVETLRAWIAAGCPPVPPPDLAEVRFTDAERNWWSFQPPRLPALAQVRDTARRVRNPIDGFLLAKLEAKGLGLSPEADRRVLMRRLYLDLTGLIPTPEQAEEFLNDARTNAYELLVDRLLDSPQYAERWARMWLDAAGYADSEGIKEDDRERNEAWRYRDAVIRAFHADKPFDRFVTEQVAGDEVEDYRQWRSPTQEQLDRVASTGFLRMASDPTYSPANGSVPERVNVVADEIEVIGSTLFGLTIGCARCHNHKYDPIPQRDYYRLGAILQTAYDPYDWLKTSERDLDLSLADQREEVRLHNEPIEAEIKRLETALWERAAPWLKKAGLDSRTDETLTALGKQFPGFKPDLDLIRGQIGTTRGRLKPKPTLRALYDMGGDPSPVFLLKRGEAQQLGEEVEPNAPSILRHAAMNGYEVKEPWKGTSGRRLALARWLTQPNHPLTARVMVNRLWRHHFGRGIVATLGNFGKTGSPPSHPELLDWLAVKFVESGWSVKTMHRLMVNSSAYRQMSAISAEAREHDPENILLSRMPLRRMDAEQLHDSILLASGRLSPKQFGPAIPIRAETGGEITSQGTKDEWRRAIYVQQKRSKPVTLLELFDLPPMSPNCTERAHSTVATQALELSHSPVVIEHARYLAGRLMDEYPDDRSRVEAAYLRTLSRRPTGPEASRAVAMLERLRKEWQAHQRAERSTEPYGFTSQWKAMGDLTHALLISAEFAYVD